MAMIHSMMVSVHSEAAVCRAHDLSLPPMAVAVDRDRPRFTPDQPLTRPLGASGASLRRPGRTPSAPGRTPLGAPGERPSVHCRAVPRWADAALPASRTPLCPQRCRGGGDGCPGRVRRRRHGGRPERGHGLGQHGRGQRRRPSSRGRRTARCSRPTTSGTPISPSSRSTRTMPPGCARWTPPARTCTRTSAPTRAAIPTASRTRSSPARPRPCRSRSGTPARATGSATRSAPAPRSRAARTHPPTPTGTR